MAKKSSSSRSRGRKKTPVIRLTPDQWLDLLGGMLLLVAVLTILSLLSAQQGALTGLWISALEHIFGWGMYLVPLFIGAVGLWLILRRFGDKLPKFEPQQMAGAGLGFIVAQMTLHFLAARILWPEVDAFALVDVGNGGGIIGATLLGLTVKALGLGGAIVSLFMGWLVAVTLIAGATPAEIISAVMKREIQPEDERDISQKSPPLASPAETAGSPKSATPLILGDPQPPPPAVAKSQPAAEPARGKSTEAEINGHKKQDDTLGFSPPPLPPGSKWNLPEIEKILEVGSEQDYSDDLIRKQARIIEETLLSLGAPVKVMEMNTGPVVVQFGVEPQFIETRSGKRTKVKVSKISSLADDLALALSARSIRVEAPIPGKGLVGIEVPNIEPSVVALRDVIESQAFGKLKGTLRMGLGQDVSGQAVAADLRAMPHLLIAGTTGSGKSVCVNAIITALLLQNTPDTLRIIMVDPKRVELTQYNGIPHLLTPVIVDVDRVVPALRWTMREMDTRYRRFARIGARNIEDFNRRMHQSGEDDPLPYIVVIVDELADLMMQSPEETERVICRLAQMARATGIHLIIATQRPSVDVVTGLIKANFPARIAFAVASSVDSRVIMDTPGAERLLGRGDMLFMPPDIGQPLRLQGTFVSERELERLIEHWRQSSGSSTVTIQASMPETPLPLQEALVQPALFPEFTEPEGDFEDELLPAAVEILLAEDRASVSLLQRRLRIG
ncbi:MAG: DNA translocase FtsK, partial [Anaerolineae bacterium]|nr:DNA translocase FtsK [Anaerolineae bacterium]